MKLRCKELVAGCGEGYLIDERQLMRGDNFPNHVVVKGKMPDIAEVLSNKGRIRAVIVTGKENICLSHAVILLRELKIPVLYYEGKLPFMPLEYVAVENGIVISGGQALSAAKAKEVPCSAATADGVKIELLSTVWDLDELKQAAGFCSGIGLFRTEGLAACRMPDIEMQCSIYEEAMVLTKDRELTVRLFDFEGDKRCLCESAPKAALVDQLKAIRRCAQAEKLRILIPNANSRQDVFKVKNQLFQTAVRHSPQPNVSIGAMIESTEAARNAAELCACSDFVAVGLSGIAREMPCSNNTGAILHYVSMAVHAAALAGRQITVCGLDIKNKELLAGLVGLNVRRFAVSCANASELAQDISRIRRCEASGIMLSARSIFLKTALNT